MKYNISINQEKALEWGLNFQQAAIIDLFLLLPTWADEEIIDNKVWYFFSKNKILDEMPLLSKNGKVDTVYRQAKLLIDKGLLEYKKVGRKDFWNITKKLKEWNFYDDNTEKNPSKHGKKSENNTEKNPTYNNTNNNNNTNDSKKEIIVKSFGKFETEAAEYFIKEQQKNNVPTFDYLINKNGIEDFVLKNAAAVEKLKRIDKLTEDQIRVIIEFGIKDQFWNKNFRGLEYLRKKNSENIPYHVVFLEKAKLNYNQNKQYDISTI